jgi:glycosyltransferase involved in cell wall biosynthesis
MSSLVSVIIPVYNRSKLLGEALSSISAQKYRHFEVIIIDDGSVEAIDQVVENFKNANDAQVIFIRQANAGPGAARNRGLAAAHGDFVAFLDSDDLWYPEMLQAAVEVLEMNPAAEMACGGWDMIDDLGKATTGIFRPSGLQPLADEDFAKALIFKNRFPIHSVLIRKESFVRFGNFDTELVAFEDWELWIRMASQGCRVVFFDAPVARWRVHHDVARSPIGETFIYAVKQVIDKIFSNKLVRDRYIGYRSSAEILLWIQQANFYSQKGQAGNAAECIHYAEKCLGRGPFGEDVFRAFLESSLSVPQTENFRRLLGKLMSASLRQKLDAEKRWQRVISEYNKHLLGPLIQELTGLLFSNPSWLIGKISRVLFIRLKRYGFFRTVLS